MIYISFGGLFFIMFVIWAMRSSSGSSEYDATKAEIQKLKDAHDALPKGSVMSQEETVEYLLREALGEDVDDFGPTLDSSVK